MEAERAGIAPVARVELAPGAGATGHAGLEIVDAEHRRHAAQTPEGLVVGAVPGELVGARAPDDDRPARVRQHEDEGEERLRTIADVEVAELAPVHLGLGPGKGLDPPRGRRRGAG